MYTKKSMENFDLFRLDGHTLRVFAKVCETGSVSRTAELFDLNQSTISHTLDKMRGAVGDVLFVKTGRSIAPTEKALSILPRVEEVLAGIEGLVATEDYDVSRDTKPMVIGIPTPALLDEMRVLYRELARVAPNAALHLRRLAPREQVIPMLEEGEADVVIAVGGLRYPTTLNHRHYGSDRLLVFYDPACRGPLETVQDYADARHGVAGFGGNTKSVVATALKELGLQRQIALAAPTASMLGDLILGTDIIATMPERLARSAYAGLASCVPPVDLPEIVYELVWHRRFDHSGRNSWLRDLIMSTASECSAPDTQAPMEAGYLAEAKHPD